MVLVFVSILAGLSANCHLLCGKWQGLLIVLVPTVTHIHTTSSQVVHSQSYIQICDMLLLFQPKIDLHLDNGPWSVMLVVFWPIGPKITFVRVFSRFVLELLLVLHHKAIIDVNWIELKIQTGGWGWRRVEGWRGGRELQTKQSSTPGLDSPSTKLC